MRGNIFSQAYMLSNFVAVMIAYLCIIKPVFGRMCMSLLFIAAAVVNTVISISHPEIYRTYASIAALPAYEQFINGFFGRHIASFVLSIAAGQFAIGLALLWKGPVEKVALGGAIIFLLAIAPLGAGSSFPCSVILAVACLLLMREKKIIPWPLTILHIKSSEKLISYDHH
ncbi:hypothetical protein [Chitinophaga filiformis]|uniref:Uncharacterized protein n=1 Tax=Chitinophaga filiformis TaxID=104663 RepID=A0A1G7MYN3_CHIFI|nr:hypothetical protein [Chitinophaga filiformis]SDF66854.1 hypothetical protein SAMN04488121_102603 [Chitinophaga filiformis]